MRQLSLPPEFGWPGAVAVLALAGAAVLGGGVAPRWQAEAEALRATRPLASPRPPPAPVADTLLPAVTDVNARVAGLLELSARSHVRVERTQQRPDVAGPVPHLLLTLSARGGYAELREFLADALQDDPGLALLRLRWRRPDALTGVLEAEMQWSLLLPAAASAAGSGSVPATPPPEGAAAAATRAGGRPGAPPLRTAIRPPP